VSELPLFPLHTVLFPGGRLPLRIFEARYIDLVRHCLRDDTRFGVCLIREGSEAGAPPSFVDTGTSAGIVDWSQRPDGLLGITATGERRFRVVRSGVRADRLVVAEVEWLEEPEAEALRPEHAWLAELFADSGAPAADPAMLAFRLAESLPLPLEFRQQLLEIDAPSERLAKMAAMLQPLLCAGSGTRSR
jgi:Lon protease-like protein